MTGPMQGRRLVLKGGAAWFAAAALPAFTVGCATRTTAAAPRPFEVRSSAVDHVRLAAVETGQRTGPTVIFVHGYSQSWQSWSRQLDDPRLAARLRLIAYDLRGHGGSDKPLDKDAYHDPRRWADDLRSVIDSSGAQRPVIVAWSYGGRVINDYLAAYGDAALGGVVYVAATSTGDRAGLGRSFGLIRGMLDDDPAAASAGTEVFLRACFERPPSETELQAMKNYNNLTPVAVRKLLGGRPAAYDAALRSLRVPVLIVHGDQDQISAPAMSQYTKSLVPQATLLTYPGAGHSTFYEFPDRFDTELLAFVERTRG